ncbi:MAG TPA: hypothetical protein PLJ47_16055 [Candidatus Hydrogenedentes bacterium]|nr:hypothetical protein [Candidatus Hydrogenedentota bacterium]HRK36111.1 hypothetical protein [Candidatus Hydrogenedentota bacterium]
MTLPDPIAVCVQPLLDALPLSSAMTQLVVKQGASPEHYALAKTIIGMPEIAKRPSLCAGLWLYVDELDMSHEISQGINGATGSFWHGIMHRREGDFGNSHYWFARVGKHPAMAKIPGYDPDAFIDAVEARHAKSPADLIELQRQEWAALFAWCAARPS